MPEATITKLTTTPDGGSRFEEVAIGLEPKDFAPPAAPLDFAPLTELGQGFLLAGTKGWRGDVPHPAPQEQLFFVIKGEFVVTASDGEERRFQAGFMLWLADTTGRGHSTRIEGDGHTLVFGAAVRR